MKTLNAFCLGCVVSIAFLLVFVALVGGGCGLAFGLARLAGALA